MSSCWSRRPGSAARSDSAKFGGRIPSITGPDGFLGRRPEALDLCRADRVGRRIGPDRRTWCRSVGTRPRAAVFLVGWPWAYRPGSGAPPDRASSVCRGQLGLARDVLFPPPRRAWTPGRPFHRSPGSPQARSAGGRPPGGPAHRRHPRRFGGRHVGRGHLPSTSRRGPRSEAASCAPSAAGRGPQTRILRCPATFLGPQWRHGVNGSIDYGPPVDRARGSDPLRRAPVTSLERRDPRAGGSARWNVVTTTSGREPGQRRGKGEQQRGRRGGARRPRSGGCTIAATSRS